MNTTKIYLTTAIIISLLSIFLAILITPITAIANPNIFEEAGEVFTFEESADSQSKISSVRTVSSVVSETQESMNSESSFLENAGSRNQDFIEARNEAWDEESVNNIFELSAGEVVEEADLSTGAWIGIGLGCLLVFFIVVCCVYRCVTGVFCCMK